MQKNSRTLIILADAAAVTAAVMIIVTQIVPVAVIPAVDTNTWRNCESLIQTIAAPV